MGGDRRGRSSEGTVLPPLINRALIICDNICKKGTKSKISLFFINTSSKMQNNYRSNEPNFEIIAYTILSFDSLNPILLNASNGHHARKLHILFYNIIPHTLIEMNAMTYLIKNLQSITYCLYTNNHMLDNRLNSLLLTAVLWTGSVVAEA